MLSSEADVHTATLVPLEYMDQGEWGEIEEVTGATSWTHRMAELGVKAGSRIQMIRPGSPCLFHVNGSRLSLRSEARHQVLVRPLAASY